MTLQGTRCLGERGLSGWLPNSTGEGIGLPRQLLCVRPDLGNRNFAGTGRLWLPMFITRGNHRAQADDQQSDDGQQQYPDKTG